MSPMWASTPLVMEGHTDIVSAVAFSPDGNTLASASYDKTIGLWDTSTAQKLLQLIGHTDRVTAVVFSPRGKLLASASWDKTIRLWASTTMQETQRLSGHTDWVRAVAFSPDEGLLASAADDLTVRLWDPTTAQEIRQLKGHTDWIAAVAFSPDGKLLASASRDETIRLWDPFTGQGTRQLKGHTNWIRAVVFSPDGELLASASNDSTVRLWDTSTGRQIQQTGEHSKDINAVSFSPDGELLASVSNDRTVKLWDVNTMQEIQQLSGPGPVTAVAFSPVKELLASARGNTIELCDISIGYEMQMLERRGSKADTVESAAFSPDGTLLASVSHNETVSLWDTSTGQELQRFDHGLNPSVSHRRRMSHHRSRPPVFSQDGQTLTVDGRILEIDKALVPTTARSESSVPKPTVSTMDWDRENSQDLNPLPEKWRGRVLHAFENMIVVSEDDMGICLVRFFRNQKPKMKKVQSTQQHYQHEFDVQWEGKEYLEEQFDHGHSIESIPMLWQDASCIKLETCTDLRRQASADMLDSLIKLIDALHWKSPLSIELSEEILGGAIWIKAKGTYRQSSGTFPNSAPLMQISIESNWRQAIEQSQKVLHHLALVLRPARDTISWSQAVVRRTGSHTQIRILPLQDAQLNTCWLPVFAQKVIAKPTNFGFDHGGSTTTSQLELPFDQLIYLSDADLPVDVDGGLCLLGAYAMLVPAQIRESATRKSIVWHLLTADRSERKPSKARKKLWADLSEWCKTNKRFLLQLEDSNQLRNNYCHFLGWTESSIITLGTEQQPYQLTRTGAATQAWEKATTTFNLGMSVGYSGSGINASIATTYGRTEVARDRDPNQSLKDWLAESVEEQTLLYEPWQKQAWLVPKIFVLYHLALERLHHMASRQRRQEIGLPYLDSISDPIFVYKLLAANLDLPFPHEPSQDQRLKHALHSILCVLDLFQRSNFTDDKRRTLRGFEAYDAIHQAKFFKLRKADTSDNLLALRSLGGWVNILDDVPIVLFYTGIDDPITPSPEEIPRRCERCDKMPPRQNYLATRISSLCELGKAYGHRSRLADSGWWRYKHAWTAGDHQHTCIEDRLQAIVADCPLKKEWPPQSLLETYPEGTVIFDPGTGFSRAVRRLFGDDA